MNSSPTIDSSFKDLKQTAADTFNSSGMADQFEKGSEMVEQKVKEYANVATDYIKQNPAYAILGAVGVGLLVGVFVARRRS